jgi:hypothetical protein
MQVQGQANNAQAVAMDAKRKLEKLRSEAEQAELDAAQAASMQEQPSSQDEVEDEAQGAQPANGYSQTPPYGGEYGMQQQQQPPQQQYGGYGQEQQPYQAYGQEQPSMSPAMPPAYASKNPSYGYGQMDDQSQNMYGGGLQNNGSSDGGFAAGVMGQGAGVMGQGGGDRFALPSPNQFNDGQQQGADPYANPF